MDFSEFIRRLGADPQDKDSEFLSARQSSVEFRQAADEADAFEEKLTRSVGLPVPEDLLENIKAISRENTSAVSNKPWWQSMALAAGVLIAIGAAGISWNMNRGWDSVETYLADHYGHDGASLLAQAGGPTDMDIEAIFARFGVEATVALEDTISVIKYCPTPDGKGVHMVLNTAQGPVTVIYMPNTDVDDGRLVQFDGMQALLVKLEKGSAAIIGTGSQGLSSLVAIVHDSIVPRTSNA